MKILGIDPGSRVSGFGLIQVCGDTVSYLDSGMISIPPSNSLAKKLHYFCQCLETIIEKHKPCCLSLEDIFLGKNVRSSFVLGHFRGVCLEQGVRNKMDVFEYAPKTVKKSVTGSGNASKDQLAQAVSYLLNVEDFKTYDVSDALALSLCHYFFVMKNKKLQRGLKEAL